MNSPRIHESTSRYITIFTEALSSNGPVALFTSNPLLDEIFAEILPLLYDKITPMKLRNIHIIRYLDVTDFDFF